MKFKKFIFAIRKNNFGTSLVELLISFGILSIGILFILQSSAIILNNSSKEKIKYLGYIVVQNKIEFYNSACLSEIKEGKFQDEPYSFIKREWEVKNFKDYYEISISSYSSGGYLLFHLCIRREKYEW